MYSPKLKKGDGVRIIAPAKSLSLPWISAEIQALAQKRLEELGLQVTFGQHVREIDEFDSTTIEHRIEDLHAAFADDSVRCILTVIGGYNSNQLLQYIDYDLIKKHPKILCGFSDITALSNAIYTKTGLVTYYGPHFFNFGQRQTFDYTLDHFRRCLFEEQPIELQPSDGYIDEYWSRNQDAVKIHPNPGWSVMHEGMAEGTMIGGNLATFHLLHGTPYMPDPSGDVILFLEDDREDHPAAFDRHLQSLLHQPVAEKIRGIVIGRSEEKSGMTLDLLRKIVDSKKELQDVPVVYGVDFGHTTPMITFPIGGKVSMSIFKDSMFIKIIEH